MGLHIGLVSLKSYRPYNLIDMEAEAQHLSRELSVHKTAVGTPVLEPLGTSCTASGAPTRGGSDDVWRKGVILLKFF